MKKSMPNPAPEPINSEDVLRRMLNTPPKPKVAKPPAPEEAVMKRRQLIQFENPTSEILFQLLRHLATHPDRSGYQLSILETCVFLDTITANVMDDATPKQITELAEAAKQVRTRLLAMPQN